MGMLERQHQDIKNSLKAAILDMTEKHQNEWLNHLPFVLLGKRVALQPDLGASPSELALGMNVRIPGQLLHDPGAPSDGVELQEILRKVRETTNRPAVQPSSHNKPEDKLPQVPDNVTHAYTRQHKTTGLQSPFEGPFLIESRPSRSTVRLEVGVYSSGEKRYEIRHLNDIKFAHKDSLAAPASRPKLGRPPTATSPNDDSGMTNEGTPQRVPNQPAACLQNNGAKNAMPEDAGHATSSSVEPHLSQQPARRGKFQTSTAEVKPRSRPPRSTRNPNPYYVDAIQAA